MVKIDFMPQCLNDYTLGSWLITGPFHSIWNQWFASLIHLRGECRGEPPKLQFAGASHEFLVFSLHPEHPVNIESNPAEMTILLPQDICQQFAAEHDAAALEKIEEILGYVSQEVLSPDQDYRFVWKKLLVGSRTDA